VLVPKPTFPAIVVTGAEAPMVISMAEDQPLYVGRSKQHAVRLDSVEISAKHARIGFENGEFWVEDLGSTNGTFVNNQQVAGRINVAPMVPIIFGREISAYGVLSEEQILKAVRVRQSEPHPRIQLQREYPVLISTSEIARPARVVLEAGASFTIGRDPGSDMWLGAPHVSRRHCSVQLQEDGSLIVSDHSTNGTAHDGGLLAHGESMDVSGRAKVLDFGNGVTVGLCFTEEDERSFIANQGAVSAFAGGGSAAKIPTRAVAVRGDPESKIRTGGTDPYLREMLAEAQNRSELGKLILIFKSVGLFERLTMLGALFGIILIIGLVIALLVSVF
jgi:pSer/pThr/pTyr-binding forkhead associated (FHA) protein